MTDKQTLIAIGALAVVAVLIIRKKKQLMDERDKTSNASGWPRRKKKTVDAIVKDMADAVVCNCPGDPNPACAC